MTVATAAADEEPRPNGGWYGGPPFPQTQHCGEVLFVFTKIKIKSTLDNLLVNLIPSFVW